MVLINPTYSRRKETAKIRAEINKTEPRKTIENINKLRAVFFEKESKIDKSLARLTKKKKDSKM